MIQILRSGGGDILLSTSPQARQEVSAGELAHWQWPGSSDYGECVTPHLGILLGSSLHAAECCVSFQTSPERLSSSYPERDNFLDNNFSSLHFFLPVELPYIITIVFK